jgi:hypothetical protein
MEAGMREQFLRGQRSFRGPAWRSKAAQEIANVSDRSAARTWDPLTIDTAKFHALRADGENGIVQAAAKYPIIEAAILLHDDGAKTDVMKLMILVDSPTDAIAKRVVVEPAVVDVWERLFFDVREMRSALSWLSGQVIEAERKAANTALAARMKLALVSGIDGVNAILALDEGAPVDEAERLFQRKLKLHLKFDEAVNMPLDSERSRMDFIKLYVDLQCSEKRLEFAGKKLAARCAETRDRYELGKMRMESNQEHAAIKANERRNKAERHRRMQADRVAAAANMQELQRHARLAEQKAAACRVAQSPLSRLAWVSAKPQQAPLSTSSPESPVTATAKLSDWAAPEFDMEPDTFDREIDAEMFGLELVAQGGA